MTDVLEIQLHPLELLPPSLPTCAPGCGGKLPSAPFGRKSPPLYISCCADDGAPGKVVRGYYIWNGALGGEATYLALTVHTADRPRFPMAVSSHKRGYHEREVEV